MRGIIGDFSHSVFLVLQTSCHGLRLEVQLFRCIIILTRVLRTQHRAGYVQQPEQNTVKSRVENKAVAPAHDPLLNDAPLEAYLDQIWLAHYFTEA